MKIKNNGKNIGAKINKIIDRTIETVVIIIFIAMVLVGIMQVFNRFVINKSLSWSEEFRKFCHIWVVFLTIGIGYNYSSHIGMELFIRKLRPKTKWILAFSNNVLWLAFGFFVLTQAHILMGVVKNQYSAGMSIRMDIIYSGLFFGALYVIYIGFRKIYDQLIEYPKLGTLKNNNKEKLL